MASKPARIWGILCILVISWSLVGCSSNRLIVKSMEPVMDKMNIAVNMNPDVDMVRDALPATLIQLDGFIEAAPEEKLLLKAAEAYFGYSFAFVEDVDKKRAGLLYMKARNYALQALLGDKSFGRFLDKTPEEFKKNLNSYGKGDVPALHWIANCWMAWAAQNINNPQVLMDVPKIEATLLRVIELDETFYYGGSHAALGAFYASRSKTIGGDPDKAKHHFDRAFSISDSKIFFFYLLYAQYYAYQIQDRELFEKTLNDVMSKPVGYFPEKNFANEVAKRKARLLLEKIDDYF